MKNFVKHLPPQCSNFHISYAVSWSGGKDCCLALHKTIQNTGLLPTHLLTIMIEDGSRSRSHGVRKEILEKQAEALGIPIIFYAASWSTYDAVFEAALKVLKEKDQITHMVFGDIQLPNDPNWSTHRFWADEMCARANITPLQPLWGIDCNALLEEFFALGFRATIISAVDQYFDASILGTEITLQTLLNFEQKGVNSCGERGEFHTFVFDGPLFQRPILFRCGQKTHRPPYWHLDLLSVNHS